MTSETDADIETWRAGELARLDAEIARLRQMRDTRQAELDADVAKKLGNMDVGLQLRLQNKVLPDLQAKIDDLQRRRDDVEFAEEMPRHRPGPQPPQSATPAHLTDGWGIEKDIPRPEYPFGARARGDAQAIENGYEATIKHFYSRVAKGFTDAGMAPDTLVSASLLMLAYGDNLATFSWLSDRCKELEQRVADLESRPTVRYCGVWQREQSYAAGSMVTHDGSVWHANVVAKGCEPGKGDAVWQLAVKRGRDAKDGGARP